MSLWSRLFRWGSAAADEEPKPAAPEEAHNTVELPAEPFVFECQSCGKVFEARRKRPQCPECDSPDVSLLSE
jgi:Zn finger protein HypA/HybF involved in hydrogenase expression